MKKLKIRLLVLIILLAVGFAAVSTNLIVNGTGIFVTNEEDFKVIFTKAVLDEIDITETTISDDGQTLTFTTNELAIMNDTSILDFEVTNNSTQYDAKVKIECVANGEYSNTYYKIESNLPEKIEAVSKENGDITVTLLRTSVEKIEDTFTCTINATAQEREKAITTNPIEPLAYYSYGLPTTASSTDYTTLGYNAFIRLDSENLLSACINNGGLFCIKINDYENSTLLMKDYFGEEECEFYSSYVVCNSNQFQCNSNVNGNVYCHDNNAGTGCGIYSSGEVHCK